jgi:hypothetical protein
MRCACYLAIVVGLACSAETKKSEPYWETEGQKFYGLGGKDTTAKVIRRGQELTTDDIAQGRDLSTYGDGGFFDCSDYWNKPSRDYREFSAIRKFIWRHWQQKERGYIRVTLNSRDAWSTSHIFIEPSSGGRWHVAWRIARHNNAISDCPDITSVAWESRRRGDEFIGSKVLVFRHEDYTAIQRF